MTEEEIFRRVERWLKSRRDEYGEQSEAWIAVDTLLDELRDAGSTGHLPWSDAWAHLRFEGQ
jgi:hypothetical protein